MSLPLEFTLSLDWIAMFYALLMVFLGSGSGGTLRYLVGANVENYDQSVALYATFIVNLIGSFGLAALLAYKSLNDLNPTLLLFFGTGFFGGFTTYSTFNYETYSLLSRGIWGVGLLYASLTAISCLLGAFLGTLTVNAVFSPAS